MKERCEWAPHLNFIEQLPYLFAYMVSEICSLTERDLQNLSCRDEIFAFRGIDIPTPKSGKRNDGIRNELNVFSNK